ncbi:hypothetical protein SBRCBS47491_009513 [Sporothrix bragantina]|uniref:SET domain-containing protein n=1 Tax=Sporothrix bragantina TaxID=671064 RepID=A0ABP0CVK3_9PEZI
MSRWTIAAMGLAWTSALILLAVFTANGNGSKAHKSPTASKDDFALTATTDIKMTGTCLWQTRLAGDDSTATCSLVVNELTAVRDNSWAPWTHRPVCTAAYRTGARGKKVRLQQFCVFTDATFRGGRGLSIIAAPHVAAAMARSLDDGNIPARLRDHPSTPLAGDPALEYGPVDDNTGQGNAFVVQDIPGRGKGVVAARKIRKGEVVFVDYATVLTQNTFSAHDATSTELGIEDGGEADEEQIMQLLQVAVAQLSEAQQTKIHALAHSLGGERIRDILRTNVFGGITIADVSYIGLFALGSRINHHCQPNAYWRYTPGYLSQEVIAMRDIAPGEEVTHSYIPLGIVHDDRQEKMRGWGFSCLCSLCTASEATRRLADTRRRRLLAIHSELSAFTSDRGKQDSSTVTEVDRGAKRLGEMVDEMLFLLDKEQAWPLLCDYYPAVTRAYLAIDDAINARRHWQNSVEAWERYGGEQHEFADELKALDSLIRAQERAKRVV